ncbi:MAG: T9SS type A sorting domain-containing protein [Bacteroidetes bacterium]|nr:T9SS type A sorting domain-containing protein [Bacteroidota bacterium]
MVFNDGREQEALANTARNNPELYRRMVERSKHDNRAVLLSTSLDDVIVPFVIRNRVTDQYDEIEAKLVFQGRRARLWIDLRDTLRVKKTTLAALAKGLDSATTTLSRNPNKGIIDNDEEVFGLPPVNRFDPSTPDVEDFLLTDIQDNFSGGSVLGFFSPWDQTDNNGSNKMNILYIDSKEGLANQTANDIASVVSTLAHEYQHLIHYRWNPQSETFPNEGCSEAASTICGYHDRQNADYLGNTNLPLFRWSSGTPYIDLEIDYQRGMTFLRYLYEQLGEGFMMKLVQTKTTALDRFNDAMQASGNSGTMNDMLKGFAVANFVLRGYSDPRYVYKLQLSNSVAKLTNSYTGTFPATGQVAVQQYASAYNLYSFSAPQGLKIKFEGSQAFTVMALLYRNNTLAEIRELNPNEDNVLGETVGCNKMAFAIVNLAFNGQTIKWTVESVTSGVDNPAALDNAVAIANVTPNPATGPVAINYRTDGTEPVYMQVYTVAGQLVRTLLDGTRMESGPHVATFDPAGLPSNAYIVRLRQGSRASSHAVVIDR